MCIYIYTYIYIYNTLSLARGRPRPPARSVFLPDVPSAGRRSSFCVHPSYY